MKYQANYLRRTIVLSLIGALFLASFPSLRITGGHVRLRVIDSAQAEDDNFSGSDRPGVAQNSTPAAKTTPVPAPKATDAEATSAPTEAQASTTTTDKNAKTPAGGKAVTGNSNAAAAANNQGAGCIEGRFKNKGVFRILLDWTSQVAEIETAYCFMIAFTSLILGNVACFLTNQFVDPIFTPGESTCTVDDELSGQITTPTPTPSAANPSTPAKATPTDTKTTPTTPVKNVLEKDKKVVAPTPTTPKAAPSVGVDLNLGSQGGFD